MDSNRNRKRFDKEISIFVTCFIISFSLWLMILLTKDYTSILNVKATYSNLPEGKALNNKMPNELRIEVVTTGFVLLTNAIKDVKLNVKIDATPARKSELNTTEEFQISLQTQITQISEQLGNEYKIKSIFPDNLVVYMTPLSQKVVPVKYHVGYNFLPQFSFEDSIHVIPSKVLIKGPKHILDKISKIETDSINVSSIKEDITRIIPFRMTEDLKQVQIKGTRGVVMIGVDKFTEAELELPIQSVNSGRYIVKTFPPKTKVKYMVTLSKYKKIKASDFKVVANTNGVDFKTVNKLSLELVQYPQAIKNPILFPNEVEFILNQK